MSVRRRVARALRNQELTWRYVFNPRPTLAYRRERSRLAEEPRRVVAELEVNGFARSSVDALLGSTALFDELAAEVRKEEQSRDEEIRNARREADGPSAAGNKKFLLELLGSRPELDPDSVFGRFALAVPFVSVANAYFGMFTHLRHYNVWRNFPSKTAARTSQLWHRDREDRRILKCFVYLSDVDAENGPLTYVPGTHAGGARTAIPESFVEAGVRRSNDDQMARVHPADAWVAATGPAGTVVFADTRGFHKGGLVRGRDRVMFVSMFTSSASQSEELFRRSREFPEPVDPALAFAVRARRDATGASKS